MYVCIYRSVSRVRERFGSRFQSEQTHGFPLALHSTTRYSSYWKYTVYIHSIHGTVYITSSELRSAPFSSSVGISPAYVCVCI